MDTKEIDLFDSIETLPEEVKEILTEFSEMENDYENCENLVKLLNQVGYTCDYYLDAIPFDLRKLQETGSKINCLTL